jgi:hypothetical protein
MFSKFLHTKILSYLSHTFNILINLNSLNAMAKKTAKKAAKKVKKAAKKKK